MPLLKLPFELQGRREGDSRAVCAGETEKELGCPLLPPKAAWPPAPGILRFSLPENKGKAPTLQPGPRPGLGGQGESKKHPRGRVSGQGSGPGTAHFLLRRSKPQAEPSGNSYDRGVASCLGAVRGRPRGSAYWAGIRRTQGATGAKGRESKPRLASPRAAGVPRAPARRAFSSPAQPGGARLGPRARSELRGLRPLARAGRDGGAGGPEERATPSSPLSHPARNLRPRIPDPRGTGPGTGRGRARCADARRRRGARGGSAASGCAALPGRCGARRAPPPHAASRGAPEAAAGARFINAKAYCCALFQGYHCLFFGGLLGDFPGPAARTPSPPPRTGSREPTRICLGAHRLP